MPWLYRDSERLCPVTVACTLRQRLRGLLGRTRTEGAILLQPASSVHTFGMRFDLDVAHLDQDLRVLRVITMRRNRLGRPIADARSVLEAEAGSLAHLQVGDRLCVQRANEALSDATQFGLTRQVGLIPADPTESVHADPAHRRSRR